jgi:hypothetical protein
VKLLGVVTHSVKQRRALSLAAAQRPRPRNSRGGNPGLAGRGTRPPSRSGDTQLRGRTPRTDASCHGTATQPRASLSVAVPPGELRADTGEIGCGHRYHLPVGAQRWRALLRSAARRPPGSVEDAVGLDGDHAFGDCGSRRPVKAASKHPCHMRGNSSSEAGRGTSGCYVERPA